ncbi:hypothetical protein NT6N_16290 [Oceaniferula spumae]|uniref:PKD domain-containing protein n=1 Tax=Oceaniferula spumae TaxID=2979115 RepID=A0AAT9FKV6_9BACT
MTIHQYAITLCFCIALLAHSFAAPVDANFAVDHIHSGNGKTKIAFDASGRMYVTEKRGRVLLFEPNGSGGFQAPTVILDISANVDSTQEAGLLGFEIDPDHANNRFIYLFHTTATDQRLVRYTMNAAFNGVESGSAVILLSGLPRNVTFHKAGDIGIHPLDPFAIFIALGDDNQIWPDPNLPQDIDSYVGKILRVDTSTGLGLPSNPHYNGVQDSVRSRVWASGLRNPFRFAFHPTRTDTIYVSENGNSTDRVAMVKAGGNGLWNGNDEGGFLTVNTPLFKVLHTDGPSLIGIEIVTSGPLAHNAQPTLYVGNWLSGISRFTLSDSTDPQSDEWNTLTPIPGGGASYWDSSGTAMDLHLGPDGHLYFTQTNGDAALASWYALQRYRFAVGTPPVASFTTSPASGSGAAPLLVTFTDSSVQGSNSLTSWHWDFGDGNSSTAQNPNHSYTNSGIYAATLTVTDSVGLTDTFQTQLTVTTDTSVSLSLDIQDGRSLPPIPASSAFTISFFQIDGSTPLSFSGGGGSESNQLVTLTDGTYNGAITLPLIGSGFVMVAENSSSPGFQNVTRGVTVSLGESNAISETFFVSTASLSGRVLSLRGNPAVVDVGIRSAGLPFSFAGARDYLGDTGLPATGVDHRVTTDDLGYFSVPVPVSQTGSTLELTFAVDTGREMYAARTQAIVSQADTNLDASITLSEWRGGPADDLSGQTYTPAVSFATIQNIFSSNCTGCHRANTTNNGSLDLTPGNSYAELVDQLSLFAPGLKLVDPGSPSRSYLFEKINSHTPQQGTRMRPTDSLPLADQALIRDWITQLAPSYENFVWTTLSTAPGSANTGVADDFDGDGESNGLDYTGLKFGPLALATDGTDFHGELHFDANSTGLTLLIQSSDDLGNWQTVASRLRGQSVWRVAPGYTVNESSPGVIQFTDSSVGMNARFYRYGVRED